VAWQWGSKIINELAMVKLVLYLSVLHFPEYKRLALYQDYLWKTPPFQLFMNRETVGKYEINGGILEIFWCLLPAENAEYG